MKLTADRLKLDSPLVETRIKRFIKDYIEKCGATGIVLGVSGGIDSCTTAALAALSLGSQKIRFQTRGHRHFTHLKGLLSVSSNLQCL